MIPNVASGGHSFNGAMRYYLHDKKADTAERVAWTATRNLGTDNPDLARRVMIATANRADELKKAAGVKAGRKATDGPVYAYSLAWHPDEAAKLDRTEMMRAAVSSLIALGAEGHQAIIVAHQDEPQPHVHVILNRVHPDTGKMLATGNDHHRLSAWALAYREARGEHLKYCPQRAKNAEARRQHPDQAQRRQFSQDRAAKQKLLRSFEWSADPSKRKGAAIKARADAMKVRHGEEWKELQAAYKSERESIWSNRASFKAIIAQHRTDTRPLWSEFGKEQARERREWNRDERTFAGVINNALKSVACRGIERDRNSGYLTAVFWHCVNKELRADAFEKMQAKDKADFAERIDAPLNAALATAKADTTKRLELARANYGERKAALKDTQAGERGQIREAWKIYFAFRDSAARRQQRETDRRQRVDAAKAARANPAPQRSERGARPWRDQDHANRYSPPKAKAPPSPRIAPTPPAPPTPKPAANITPSFRDAARPQTVPDQAQGAQSVSELRAMYGDKTRERNRDRDRTHSRRKERVRSRTRTDDKKPDPA